MTRKRLWAARCAALAAVFGGALYLSGRASQLALLDEPAYVFFAAELVNYLALLAAERRCSALTAGIEFRWAWRFVNVPSQAQV